MEIIRFYSENIANLLASEPARLENLAFGALLLDRNARIVKYNRAQGMIWGRNSGDVIGKEFFNDVARCCRNTPLHMRYYEFLREGFVDVLHEYDTVYKGAAIRLKMHLKSQADGDRCWLFTKVVSRADVATAPEDSQLVRNLTQGAVLRPVAPAVERHMA